VRIYLISKGLLFVVAPKSAQSYEKKRVKAEAREIRSVRGGKDAGRLNAIFPNKKYALKQENVKGKDGRGGERAEGRKRYGIVPEAERRTARFPRLEGRNPIRAAAARKKRWMESKQLDLTFLGILG